jgi:hypothetical protein
MSLSTFSKIEYNTDMYIGITICLNDNECSADEETPRRNVSGETLYIQIYRHGVSYE